jgi:gamma-glutamyl-gamma-aminobutyrate hydrolase PuuD
LSEWYSAKARTVSSDRPIIAITSYTASARWSYWELPAALLPLGYVEGVAAAGGRPVLLPPMIEGVSETLSIADGLVFAGGPDIDPACYGDTAAGDTFGVQAERDAAELALLHAAMELDVPLLGICRGMQLLNVAYGGTLTQHLPDVVGHDGHRTAPGHFDVHGIRTSANSHAGNILGERASVYSAHHQGIAVLGDGLVPTAWAQDGSVEALEDPTNGFAVGVLWHPEEGTDGRLFSALVDAARAATGARGAKGLEPVTER